MTDECLDATLAVADTVEGFTSTSHPRLTWTTSTDSPAWVQTRATITTDRDGSTETAVVDGDASVLVEWPFAPIRPRESVSLKVRVTGSSGDSSPWSAPVEVVGGTVAEWTAPFIGSDIEEPVLLRNSFRLAEGIRRATLFVSAFGAAYPRVNGTAVGDRILSPGWTSYQWRVDYDVYDITTVVRSGDNAIGIELFGAWFTERFGFRDAAQRFYQGPPSASVLLVVDYADGTAEEITTGPGWRWVRGAARSSSIYQGEHYDSAAEIPGWDQPHFTEDDWSDATSALNAVVPTPRVSPPVRVTDEIAPVAVLPSDADGAVLLDFGQNLVGRLRLHVDCPAGTRITLRHAEVLEDGRLGVRPLRNAAATDVLIARGGEQTWAPAGTFHGFRFAEISGYPDAGRPGAVTAQVVGTDLRRIGGFATSHPLLQRLHENIVWSARGNFLSVPTDCPQRDERLGWTGDAQVFTPAAAFLFDCTGFFRSWLRDVRLEQSAADGVVPMVVPAVIPQVPGLFQPIAAWGDAITVIPHVLHEYFADPAFLQENIDAMGEWVTLVRSRVGATRLWEDGRQFGDWLDPDALPDQPGRAKTDPDIVATAYFYRSAALTADAAETLGRTADAEALRELAEEIRSAFSDAYVTPRGRMVSDSPTAYALAITFGLVRDDRLPLLGDRLAELVRRGAFRISTGFAGTPIVCDALTMTGHADTAGRLLLQTENPSWLYPVTMGATTTWERWDSMLEDGSINPGQMTSFNHFALGAVADWMHRAVGGLTATEPGYRRTRFSPVFVDGLDDAGVWHDTPYGRLEASWHRTGTTTAEVSLTVPPGIRVDVDLPGVRTERGNGEFSWSVDLGSTRPERPFLDLNASLTAVLESPEAYRAVIEELEAWDPDRATSLRRSIQWTPGRTLRDPLDKVPVPVMQRIQERLIALTPDRS